VGHHLLQADEPVDSGGSDAGPDPYDLLLAALGACISITLRMYADRKQWPLEGVQVRLSYARVHAEDCATCDSEAKLLDIIEVELSLVGDLSEDQRRRLKEIAEKCPVHRTLTSPIPIRTRPAPQTTQR
jgi:putative redox protein